MAATDNWILSRLSDAERAELLDRARRRPMGVGQNVFTPGDGVDAVWFPEKGVISVITESESGLQAEAGLTGPESAAGLMEAFGSEIMASRGVVQAAGSAWIVPAAACRQLHDRSPNFRRAVQLAAEFHTVEARQSLFCRSYHPIEARLARWLLEMLDRSETPRGAIVLTQEVLAAMLAVQRTTVSTTVARLRRTGVLGALRSKIEVRDKAALEEIACPCRRSLAKEKQRIHSAMPG